MEDETQVESSAEETTEVEEETTDTTEETESSEGEGEAETEQPDDELVKARKVADDQKKRAEKAEAELKKLKGKGKESDRAPNKDDQALSALEQRVVRAELSAAGIKDREEQEFVIGAAQRLGVEPGEAASDPIVAAKLEKMREEQATKNATPTPGKRTGAGSTTTVTKLADKAEKGEEVKMDSETRAKVRAELARRAQQRRN